MTATGINQCIVSALNKNDSLTKSSIVDLINKIQPNVSSKSITWQLHQLKAQGLIHSPSYGIYSLFQKEQPQFQVSPALTRCHNKVMKELPYIQFCVWDNRWFNALMLHQPLKYYLVIEVEKDAAEAVFNIMTTHSNNVFLNPTEELYKRYISNFNEAIIIKSLISEAPLQKQAGVTLATIEKLLVDCLSDIHLFAAQQDELEYIYTNAFSKYNININKLKRYARRRNQLKKVNEILHKTWPK